MRNRNYVCLALGTLFAAGGALPAGAQTCSQPIKIDCLHARPAVMPEARFAYGATTSGNAYDGGHTYFEDGNILAGNPGVHAGLLETISRHATAAKITQIMGGGPK